MDLQYLDILREVGALALVAAVLLYLLREYLPGLTERYLDQLRMSREDFTRTLERQRADFTRVLDSQQQLFETHMGERAKLSDERHAQLMQEIRNSRGHNGQ